MPDRLNYPLSVARERLKRAILLGQGLRAKVGQQWDEHDKRSLAMWDTHVRSLLAEMISGSELTSSYLSTQSVTYKIQVARDSAARGMIPPLLWVDREFDELLIALGRIYDLLPLCEGPPDTDSKTAIKSAAPAIFVSYRRTDEAAFAGRLYDRLAAAFGASRVFMDVDSIELGSDFIDTLEGALNQCGAFIAVIGRNWVTATDSQGMRRLSNSKDFVRLELERALDRCVPLIPVLVDGASMPWASDLPESLRPLLRRNGWRMSHAQFGSDCIRLIRTLEQLLS